MKQSPLNQTPRKVGENGIDQDPEQELALIVARVLDDVTAGRHPDLEMWCSAHPEHAKPLRELWGTLMVTQALGKEAGSRKTQPETLAAVFELPYRMDDFVLLEEIGRGGMGIVYRARRYSTGEVVAIKMMLKGELATDIEKQRFDAEAKAAALLSHPNIVPIYEVGEHRGRSWFCMRLISGKNLAQLLSAGPLPAETIARILMQVSQAIEYAHQHGILHRDLKPSNILMDETGRPYVCDFGLAKRDTGLASLTKSGAVIGTPAYMAPEQAAGARGQMGPTSDVYSLGAILYHMLTGHPPFQAATPVDTVLMVLEQDPVPPRVLNRNADRVLEMVTLRCLQKPQDLRYPTAGALADDLQKFLKREPVSAAFGRFGQIMAGLFRETHHAPILQNWGVLWMWHSLVVLIASVATNVMFLSGVTNRAIYELMWGLGFGAWAAVFWFMRRQQGPVTFVERQVAHVWAASMIAITLLFPFEGFLGLDLMRLAPALSVVAAMTFLVKAGILTGLFYFQVFALLATAVLMAIWHDQAMFIFGIVCAGCFFFPGYKYYRQRLDQRVEQ